MWNPRPTLFSSTTSAKATCCCASFTSPPGRASASWRRMCRASTTVTMQSRQMLQWKAEGGMATVAVRRWAAGGIAWQAPPTGGAGSDLQLRVASCENQRPLPLRADAALKQPTSAKPAPGFELLIGPERGRHGPRVGQPRGLDQDVVKPIPLLHQRFQRLHLGGTRAVARRACKAEASGLVWKQEPCCNAVA